MSSLVNERFTVANRPNAGPALVDAEGRPTLLSSALGRQLVGCGIEEEIVDRLDCEVANISAAWRWHGRPERVIRAAISGARTTRRRGRGRLREDGFFARHPVTPEQIQEQIRNGDFSQSRVYPALQPGRGGRLQDVPGVGGRERHRGGAGRLAVDQALYR